MKVFAIFLVATLAVFSLCNLYSQENVQDHSEPASPLIEAAVQNANREGKLVLLYFGAEECVYCEQLSRVLSFEDIHSMLVEYYVQIRIDVGEFDQNLDLFNRYMGKEATGIPALVILGKNGTVKEAINGEEWGESDQEVYEFVIAFLEMATRK